jgi:ankyrin repeat protein
VILVSQVGKTAIISAAFRGDLDIVKALIEAGADVHATDMVRRECSVSAGEGANDFGSESPDLGDRWWRYRA